MYVLFSTVLKSQQRESDRQFGFERERTRYQLLVVRLCQGVSVYVCIKVCMCEATYK